MHATSASANGAEAQVLLELDCAQLMVSNSIVSR